MKRRLESLTSRCELLLDILSPEQIRRPFGRRLGFVIDEAEKRARQ